MAWRIDESVVRGEIDNRVRDRVSGRIWFAGRDEPVELELAGNAWRDLAGRRLEFANPNPKPLPDVLRGLAVRQTGVIGDCTASRKVKVPDIPLDQIGKYYAARKKWTWHWGNSLYLEWFSPANGRVVIESASYQLTISPEVAWEMTPAEEEAQRRANAEAIGNFMSKLGEPVAAERAAKDEPVDDAGQEWDEDDAPLTEAEAEKMHSESDLLVDRINARVEREGIENYEKILAEELERRRQERGEKPPTPEEEAQRAEWMGEVNRAAEEAASDSDAELEADLDKKHPVAEQAFELSLRLMQEPEEHGWLPPDASEEHPLADMAAAASKAGAKFAGALNGETWPPPVEFCANNIVRLKRARGYLDDALLAAEMCGQQKLADAAWLTEAQRELNALAHACDELIGELRTRLERGFD
jgi:hypothetical protein